MKIKTTKNLLDCYPTRLMEWNVNEETGLIVVICPKYRSALTQNIFNPFLKNKSFPVNLDKLGTVIWENCDGKNTVGRLGEILAEKFGKEIEPIYDRLGKFILHLKRNKFIELKCPQ